MNPLTIELQQVGRLTPTVPPRTYEPEQHGLVSILTDACEALADAGQTRFVVGGFGQDRWPVDVLTDLPVVMEQVPDVTTALRRNGTATLGFYEQGIERILTLTPHEDVVTIECASMTDWQPSPAHIEVPRQEFLALLERLLDGFVDQVRQRCPALADHQCFQAWLAKRA